MFANRVGTDSLLRKDDAVFQGSDEVTLKNIEACTNLCNLIKTGFGPFGMNKLIVNRIEKHIVTSDAGTVLEECDIMHPAARLVMEAAKHHESVHGDGANLVISLAGALLENSGSLIKKGVHPSVLISGYTKALEVCTEYAKELAFTPITDVTDIKKLSELITPIIACKDGVVQKQLPEVVAEGCVNIIRWSGKMELLPEKLRICKSAGGYSGCCSLVNGVVVARPPSGAITSVENAHVVVLGCALETELPEAKAIVVMQTPEELRNFSKYEEDRIRQQIEQWKSNSVQAVVSCGLKEYSKFGIRRLAQSIGASLFQTIADVTPSSLGYAQSIKLEEHSGQQITVLRKPESDISTVILRAGTRHVLDELARGVEDAVGIIRSICKGQKEFVPGAGATECALAQKLNTMAIAEKGLSQYPLTVFANALKQVPRGLVSVSGLNSNDVMAALIKEHADGNHKAGICLTGTEESEGICKDVTAIDQPILDHLETKLSAMKYAVDAVCTVLQVDHAVVSKQAGGPKPGGQTFPEE